MKDGLAQLLFRKTEESRLSAQHEVENWRMALAAVAQAEKQAEYNIRGLPTLAEIDKVAEEATTANHVAAVGLSLLARQHRIDLMATAKSQLEGFANELKEKAAKAHASLNQAWTEHNANLSTSRAIEREQHTTIKSQIIRDVSSPPEGGQSLGCILGILIVFFSFISQSLVIVGLAFVTGLLMTRLLPMLMYLLWLAKKQFIENTEKSLAQAVSDKSSEQQAQAVEHYNKKLPALEAAIAQAEIKYHSIETALELLAVNDGQIKLVGLQ